MISRRNGIAAALALVAAAAVFSSSCGAGEQRSPTAPDQLSSVTVLRTETLADEAPEGPPEGEPAPGTEPPPDGNPPPEAAPPTLAPVPVPPPLPPGVLPPPVPGPVLTHPRAGARIEPSPVPYSGQPITDAAGCRDLKHTWFYEQVLYATSGIAVTFTERENFFDSRFVSKVAESIHIPGNGTVRLRSRWCSGYPLPHVTQTNYRGKDENGNDVAVSTRAQLLAP